MKHHGGPLLGYNNNIPYKGNVYHVQTEDSGSKRPHVFTHLFADGGRIIKTRKTSYAHVLGQENVPEKVRALMREQHKGMVLSLRDGEFDALIDPAAAEVPPAEDASPEPPPSAPIELLERAAQVDDDQFQEEIERITTAEPGRRTAGDSRTGGTYSFVGEREPAVPSGRGPMPRRMRATRPPGDSDAPGPEQGPPAVDETAPGRRRPREGARDHGAAANGSGVFGATISSGRRFDELVAAFLERNR